MPPPQRHFNGVAGHWQGTKTLPVRLCGRPDTHRYGARSFGASSAQPIMMVMAGLGKGILRASLPLTACRPTRRATLQDSLMFPVAMT